MRDRLLPLMPFSLAKRSHLVSALSTTRNMWAPRKGCRGRKGCQRAYAMNRPSPAFAHKVYTTLHRLRTANSNTRDGIDAPWEREQVLLLEGWILLWRGALPRAPLRKERWGARTTCSSSSKERVRASNAVNQLHTWTQSVAIGAACARASSVELGRDLSKAFPRSGAERHMLQGGHAGPAKHTIQVYSPILYWAGPHEA